MNATWIGRFLPASPLVIIVSLILLPDASAQSNASPDDSDNVVPVAASVQVLRNVELALGSARLRVSSIEYAQQGTSVYLLPVWVVAGVESYNATSGRWEALSSEKPLPGRTGPGGSRLRVQLANLLAQEDTRTAVEQRLREHVAKSEAAKPEQVRLRAPTFNRRGYRVALCAASNIGDSGELALTRSLVVPPAVAEDSGPITFDLIAENIAALQAANSEPVLLRDTYLKLSGQMRAKFEKQQYLANFETVENAVTAMQNELKSIQPSGQPAPDVFVQVPIGGKVEGKTAVTTAFSQYLVGSIGVREGANVNYGLLNELTERVLGRILAQMELTRMEESKRVAVMIGNMATVSATIGEIKTLSKETREQREKHLRQALELMDARRAGERKEYNGSLGVEFGARTMVAGISGRTQAEAAYKGANEEERTNRRKEELDTLDRGLDELAAHFDGRVPTLTGIRFDQSALDQSMKSVRVELQQNSFTIGWSQHDWTGIKLTNTAGYAVSPELLHRQVDAARARYDEFQQLLGTPARLRAVQELVRQARAATEQAKATAERVAELEKRGASADVERRLKRLETRPRELSARYILNNPAGNVWRVAFSPDGHTVATGGEGPAARLWDAATGRERFELATPQGHAKELKFSPSGFSLAIVDPNDYARLWDVATGAERAVLREGDSHSLTLAYSSDGKTIATGHQSNTARLWDLATGAFRAELVAQSGNRSGRIEKVEFSPDGKTLVTVGDDAYVRLWDVATRTERFVLRGHTGRAYSVAFSPDGNTLATGGRDTTVRLWDVATGAERFVLKTHKAAVVSVSFSPDGKTLATSSLDHTIRLWDVAKGTERVVIEDPGLVPTAVSFSPDGKLVSGCMGDGPVRLWDADTGVERAVLTGHTAWVMAVAFSPDGKTVATASRDRTARVWELHP